MDAGRLNSRVVIEQRTASKDAFGQPYEVWTTVATVWAWILHSSGLETIKANADTSVVKASIRVRYRPEVTAAMRVKHHDIVYEIKAVLPADNGEFMDLVCIRTYEPPYGT
jgi:SPP1 family predicted phage head-tail adaptor